jgi:hypothetical protein
MIIMCFLLRAPRRARLQIPTGNLSRVTFQRGTSYGQGKGGIVSKTRKAWDPPAIFASAVQADEGEEK